MKNLITIITLIAAALLQSCATFLSTAAPLVLSTVVAEIVAKKPETKAVFITLGESIRAGVDGSDIAISREAYEKLINAQLKEHGLEEEADLVRALIDVYEKRMGAEEVASYQSLGNIIQAEIKKGLE